MKLRNAFVLVTLLALLASFAPHAAAAPSVTASSAGSKPVGEYTFVWGTASAPGVTDVWTEVRIGGRWSRSQVGRTDANGRYSLELSYGFTAKGDYQFRVGNRSRQGTVYSPSFTLTRTGWHPENAGDKLVGQPTNVWSTFPVAANRTVWTEAIVGGRWSRSQVRTANAAGFLVIPLTYGINEPGTQTFRVGAATSRGTIYSERFTIQRTTAPVPADGQALLAAVNRHRAAGATCGTTRMPPVPALSWDDRLGSAAQRHSDDMARNRFMGHQGSDGTRVGDRVSAAGFNWRTVGENVAAGGSGVEDIMRGWMGSAGHCRNIMNGQFTHFGGAKATNPSSPYRVFWTQVFAAPR